MGSKFRDTFLSGSSVLEGRGDMPVDRNQKQAKNSNFMSRVGRRVTKRDVAISQLSHGHLSSPYQSSSEPERTVWIGVERE